MESIHNASWAAPFPSCSSIADVSGLDLPDIFNEQAWAETNQYAARFIPSAALANHYTLPEGTFHPVFLSEGGLLFHPQCGQDQHDMVLWPQYVHPADAHKSTTQPLPRMSYDTCSSLRQTTILTSAEDRTIQLSGPQPLPTIGRSCQLRRRAQPKGTPVSVLSSTDPSSIPNNHRLCLAPREVLQAENCAGKRNMRHMSMAPPIKIARNSNPAFAHHLLCVHTRWRRGLCGDAKGRLSARRGRKKGLFKRPCVNGSKPGGCDTTRDKRNANLVHENRVVLSIQEEQFTSDTLEDGMVGYPHAALPSVEVAGSVAASRNNEIRTSIQ
ncbi:uncharacterized protein PG998_014217 [Apiospora kogelbergensis]|uniref:uncharacterized protein n=1 Tax=Apiospora kogelbergensis TaxID=1337665 RepID=UPI00312EBC1D